MTPLASLGRRFSRILRWYVDDVEDLTAREFAAAWILALVCAFALGAIIIVFA